MVIHKTYGRFLKCLFISGLLIITFSCGSRSDYAGIYRTDQMEAQKKSELELNEGGEGYWRVGDEEESFSWYRKGSEIRLYTKKGGVIVAKIRDHSLEIVLRRGETLTFKKVK